MLVSCFPTYVDLLFIVIRGLSRSPKSGETPQMSVCGSCLILDGVSSKLCVRSAVSSVGLEQCRSANADLQNRALNDWPLG